MTRVLGVDGCVGGWVGITLVDGTFSQAQFADTFTEIASDSALIVGVDIPLGSTGVTRAADAGARRLLGRRGASVFAAAPGDVLDSPDYATANHRCRERHGRGLSVQAWNLVPKMLDVEPHWSAATKRIFEVHPELSFMTMNGAALEDSKHTWAGQRARAALLARVGIVLPDNLGTAGAAGPDDVLDAAAVAWTAHRIAAGDARCVPDPPERDRAGRPVAIWR